MGLAEKMFTRDAKGGCPLRSDCKKESDQKYFASLFERSWEVFVIKRDELTGKFDWFTQCCEAFATHYEKPDALSTTCS